MELTKRILSGVLVVAFALLMVIFYRSWLLNLMVAFIAAMSLYEVLIATKYIESKVVICFSMLVAVTMPFALRLTGSLVLLVLVAYCFVMFAMLIFNHKKMHFEQLCVALMLALLFPFFFSNIVMLREGEFGALYICMVFIAAWMSDTAAYFVGSALGRHKLCPDISPKKTVEGAIGGVLGSLLGFVLFSLITGPRFDVAFNYAVMLPVSVVGAVIGMCGDLSASLIKRSFKIKDFGTLIPGHGGVLDRFDSVLFVAPFMYLVSVYLPFIARSGI